jgi:hypothetical protein
MLADVYLLEKDQAAIWSVNRQHADLFPAKPPSTFSY